MNAATHAVMDMDEADRFQMAVAIAAEHVDWCLTERQSSLTIARAIFGPDWAVSFAPTRGQLVEAYARVWLKMGVAV